MLVNSAVMPLQDDSQRPWLQIVGIGDFWTSDYKPALVFGPPVEPLTVTTREQNRRGWHYTKSNDAHSRASGGSGDLPSTQQPEDSNNGYKVARIVLSHNPDTVRDLTKWDSVDAILSGMSSQCY